MRALGVRTGVLCASFRPYAETSASDLEPGGGVSPQRVAIFIGTRPEAIKLAPVVRALRAAGDLVPIVISTGQHREMLDQVAHLFELEVHHELSVMQPNQQLVELTARLIVACAGVLTQVLPSFALVQGDTTTALAASLSCFDQNVPVGHVEAGLRTGNPRSPFPEEMNRTLTSRLCALHFAPTPGARQNLLDEGISLERISVTGNTVIDALHCEVERQRSPAVRAEIWENLRRSLGERALERPFVLVTGHRRENFGDGFEPICTGLAAVASRFPDHDFVYPVHMNPNVQRAVREHLGASPNIRLIAPQPYSEFVALMQSCRIVLTDSGGVQEEAPSLGKPVLVMRDTTERPEGVQAGAVRLVGANPERLVEEVSRLLTDRAEYDRMALAINPYGDGQAAPRIVERLRSHMARATPPDGEGLEPLLR
jgi:UDP-N-acetylglucosamine 2-epimerase (non-hydrolysing)